MSERGIWVFRDGELVPKHLATPLESKRSDLPTPMLIRDNMESTWNPADGQHYDSKRAYEKAVRANGCEIVGNEKIKASPKTQMDDPARDVAQAIEMTGALTPKRKRKNGRQR